MTTAPELPPVITLDPDARARLIAVAGCAAQGHIATGRPVLANLHARGRHLWATDSYVLSRWDVPANVEDDLPEVLIPAGPLATILRAAPKTSEVSLHLDPEGVRVIVGRTDLLTVVRTVHTLGYYDGTSPGGLEDLWPDAIPTEDGGYRPPIRASLLRRLAAVAGTTMGADGDDVIRLYYRESTVRPVVVTDAAGKIVGLAMPMRADGDAPGNDRAPINLLETVEVPA